MSAKAAVALTAPPSIFVSLSGFLASCKETIEYELNPFIMSRSFTMLSGPPKEGKTALAAYFCSEVSAQGKVILFVEEEGPAEILRERFAPYIGHEWEKHDRTMYFAHRKGFRLDDPRHVDALIQQAIDVEAKLIVIDPSDKVHSRNENTSTGHDGISELIQEIQRIISKTGAAVLLIHHNKKDTDEMRGSTAWKAGADSVIQVRGIPKAERKLGVLRFHVENTDNRRFPFESKLAVVTMPQDGCRGSIKFLVPESKAARIWREEVSMHVPAAPEYITAEELREAAGIGKKPCQSAIDYAKATGRVVHKPGKGGGYQRPDSGLVRDSP